MLSDSHFLENDIPLSTQSTEFKGSISCIRWAHHTEKHERLFAVGTWDGQLRIYNVEDEPGSNGPVLAEKFVKQVKWPIVDIAWGALNKSLFYSMIDNTVSEVDL